MKNIILIALFISQVGLSQAPASLQEDVKKLYTVCHDMDISELTEMLCTTDSTAYSKLDDHFQNDARKFRYVFTNAKYNYSPPRIIDGKTYYIISFRNVVRITYFGPIDVSAVQAELKEKFAAQNIAYDKTRNAYMITYNARMVAVQDKNWKFVFLDHTLPKLEDCLSEHIRNELGI